MIIVPNTRWAEELNKRALAASGSSASLEKSAVPIRELLALHYDNSIPVISHTMRRLLLLNVMGGIKTSYFRRISRGVVEVVMNAISELKKNSITPEELKEILSTRGGAREADLLAAYEGYEKALGSHGFKDEDDLYQNLKNIKFAEPPHLAGFDSIKPWMRSLNGGKIVFEDIKAPSPKTPEIFSLNSPFAEAEFVREKINGLLKDGLAPEDIAVYLPAQSQFAWWLGSEFTKEVPFSIATSPVSSGIFNDPNLPQEGTLKDFVSKSRETLAGIYSEHSKTRSEYYEARGLGFIDTINKALKRLQFEAKELDIGSTFTKEEFLNIFGDEVNALPPWPVSLPFRLVSWEDAGLYEHKFAIMPQMNEGIFPPTGARISFFSEPDTLSTKPDSRIEEIFPKREFEIRNALKRFAVASGGKTIITFHAHNSIGKDASPSPLIIKYECRGAPLRAPSGLGGDGTPPLHTDRASSCGTNFTSNEVLKVLKERVEKMTHSATKLEEYGTCPFAYFCRRILGIEPPDDITPEVQPKDRGTLIHESLEAFFVTSGKIYNNYISEGVDHVELRRLVTASIEKAFSNKQDITAKYNKDMVGHLKTRAVNYITAVLENEAEILGGATQRPSHFELEFNGELFSTGSNDKIKINGFIDRIDSDDKTFTVIDYKTGDTSSVKSGIMDGTELQMPIYTFMAEKVLKKEPAAALLYSIRKQKRATGIIKKSLKENVMGKKQSRITVTDEEWDELIRTGIETAIRYVEEIKNGRFESAPDKCPGYCNWKNVCRYK